MSDPVLTVEPILDRFSLNGRTALVTGGGQGIGRAFAHALGEAGAAVAVVDLVSERAETVAQELTDKGIETMAVTADVTKPEDATRMVQTIVDAWGSLTIGVNNAGIGQWVDSEAMSFADWQRMLSINLDRKSTRLNSSHII